MSCFSNRDTFVSPVLKYFLFFFNFFFWVAGLILLAVGTWAYTEKDKFTYKDARSIFDFIFDVSVIFISIGVVMFVLGFFGCLGALRENTCFLKLYYISLCLIFLAQVGGAIFVFLKSKEVREKFVGVLKDELIPLYTEGGDKKNLVDWIQEELKCCGMSSSGYRDWNNNRYFNCTSNNLSSLRCVVPHSCCIKQDTISPGVPNVLCGDGALDDSIIGSTRNINEGGCVAAVMRYIQDNMPVVAGIIVGLALPQVMGIVLARNLDGQIQDQLARWRYMYAHTSS